MTTTASENAAYVEFVTRDALVQRALLSGDFTDRRLAEDIVEQTFRSGRGSLNEAEFRRVADYLAADPDNGPALFAAKGVDVIDNPVAARRFADVCLNSFAGHTLVVLADGTRVPIADIDVGVSVAAFDVDAGVVTSGAVTAVLSHGDELFDVGLADGSVLSVTDDHRFWDPSNTVWSPIGDLADEGGSVFGLDGANIAVTGIDVRVCRRRCGIFRLPVSTTSMWPPITRRFRCWCITPMRCVRFKCRWTRSMNCSILLIRLGFLRRLLLVSTRSLMTRLMLLVVETSQKQSLRRGWSRLRASLKTPRKRWRQSQHVRPAG